MSKIRNYIDTLKRMDWIVLLSICVIIIFGLVFVGSAGGAVLLKKQLRWLVIALISAFVVVSIDYKRIIRYSYIFYAVFLAMTVYVTFFGESIRGARSWIDIGVFKIQPSELMKLSMILALANYVIDRDHYKKLFGMIAPFAITFIPVAIILKQPDLGTAMVFPPILFGMLYAAGTPAKNLMLVVLLAAIASPFLWTYVARPHQKERIEAWLNPESNRKVAYQLERSKNAIGCGGLLGVGLTNGSNYLPERQGDFIFAVIAEEWGLARTLVLLLAYTLLLIGGIGVAERTREPAGRMLAVGVVMLIGGQAFINMAVVLGLLPTTGITLPLISYGGTSLVITFVSLAILLNISSQRLIVFRDDHFE